MRVSSRVVEVKTFGPLELHPVTQIVENIVRESCSGEGIAWISVEGATPALLILEKGSEKMFIEYITKLVPISGWRHGNAYAHLISTLVGTTLAIPIIEGKLVLKPSQELYLLETRFVYNHTRRLLIEVHCKS